MPPNEMSTVTSPIVGTEIFEMPLRIIFKVKISANLHLEVREKNQEKAHLPQKCNRNPIPGMDGIQ